MMRYIGIALLTVGIGLLAYSITLDRYTDKDQFYQQTTLLRQKRGSSQAYFELRESYLTPKYKLQDYSLVCIVLGLFALIAIPKKWQDFESPKSKGATILIGALAVLLTIGGYVGDLFLELTRESYPPWADSIGIPLGLVPVLLLILLVWFAVNLIGLKKPFRTGVSISELDFRSTHYWYLTLIFLTVIATLILIVEGDFWWVVAGIGWIYFYLALLLGRQKEKPSQNISIQHAH